MYLWHVDHKLLKGEKMFHSTPKLIHISSRFEDDDPLRRKSQFGIDCDWQHVCLLESL